MSTKKKPSPDSIVREIKRRTRRKYSAEEKIRIVLEGLRGEESIADLCRKEGIHPGIYYKWGKGKEQKQRLWTLEGKYRSFFINDLMEDLS